MQIMWGRLGKLTAHMRMPESKRNNKERVGERGRRERIKKGKECRNNLIEVLKEEPIIEVCKYKREFEGRAKGDGEKEKG